MKYVYTGARILLGIMFLVIGVNLFLLFLTPPPANMLPKNALTFSTLMFATHYVYFTGGTQAVAAVLVLINRYTGAALIVLGAVLANILAFHITMWPQTLVPMPIIALLLWILTCWPLRREFAAIFSARLRAAEA